jgi:CheY-like chemotaxis protein
VNPREPFSVEDFLDKLEANDPEVALDPTVQAGLQRLAEAVHRHDDARPRLLLIDDDDADAELFAHALRENGVTIEVTRVRDGQEAIDYFAGEKSFADRVRFPLPRLTILDLKLPIVGGLEVLNQMRRLPHCATLAVIVLAASNAKADMDEALRLNASAFISKSDNCSALVQIVEQVKASLIDTPKLPDQGADRV